MEVLVIGRVQYDALIPVLAAGVIGDMTCSAWGIKHTIYHIRLARPHGLLHLEGGLLLKAAAAGILFGLASTLFAELTHSLQKGFKRWMRISYLRPVVGGILVIGLTWIVGTRDYLGLGVDSPLPHAVTILSAFTEGGAHPLSWWWKILFTAVTISSGFKGGEVTPLFFIGATLGSVVGGLLGAPIDLFAGLGFIAVFAAAANTPLACTVMGVELFGGEHAIYFGVASFVAYHCSGHSGIYLSQRLGVPKRHSPAFIPDTSLREVRESDSATTSTPWEWFNPGRTDSNSGARLAVIEQDGLQQDRNSSIMKHEISSREMGKIRIYLTPRERTGAVGFWGSLNAKPLYRTIINAAKKDGLRNAAAFMSHYGFSDHGKVHAHDVEIINPNLTLCVEIIDHKDKLEEFCRKHGDLLKGKTIVYKHVEHWDIGPKVLIERDASPNTLVDGESDRPLDAKALRDSKTKS
jgi:PII-like signaling protein